MTSWAMQIEISFES